MKEQAEINKKKKMEEKIALDKFMNSQLAKEENEKRKNDEIPHKVKFLPIYD